VRERRRHAAGARVGAAPRDQRAPGDRREPRPLIQQLLVEGALLGTLGAIAAVALAWALVQALQGIQLPLPVDVAFDLRIDARVLTFSIVSPR
jgi:hypothetical protein